MTVTTTEESKHLLPSSSSTIVKNKDDDGEEFTSIDDVDNIAINRNNRTTRSILKKIVGVSGLFCAFAVVKHSTIGHRFAYFSLTKSEQLDQFGLTSYAPLSTASDSKCATGLIKTYSIDKRFNKCGETCMKDGDFKGFKYPFEKGLTKAGSVDNPCQVAGYDTFLSVETHGDPLKIVVSTLNMFGPTK